MQNVDAIVAGTRECLRHVPLDQRLRLLGVRASGLVRAEQGALPAQEPGAGRSLPLFD